MVINGFEGKAILITGGSSGIGKALALNMIDEGAVVGVLSNSESELEQMPEEIYRLRVDIRDRKAVQTAVEDFHQYAGRIDMLVNSAGVSLWKDFLEMDDEFWDLIYDVNVKGTFLVTQAVVGYMKNQRSGIIVNVSSMSGLKSGLPGASAYMSSKWAIVGLTRNLHLELKNYGIRVSCICPGSTRTTLHEKVKSPDQDKMLEANDVAKTIMFMLAAPANGHIQLLAEPAMFEDWK